jgi:hypothetical protein
MLFGRGTPARGAKQINKMAEITKPREIQKIPIWQRGWQQIADFAENRQGGAYSAA